MPPSRKASQAERLQGADNPVQSPRPLVTLSVFNLKADTSANWRKLLTSHLGERKLFVILILSLTDNSKGMDLYNNALVILLSLSCRNMTSCVCDYGQKQVFPFCGIYGVLFALFLLPCSPQACFDGRVHVLLSSFSMLSLVYLFSRCPHYTQKIPLVQCLHFVMYSWTFPQKRSRRSRG